MKRKLVYLTFCVASQIVKKSFSNEIKNTNIFTECECIIRIT